MILKLRVFNFYKIEVFIRKYFNIVEVEECIFIEIIFEIEDVVER